MLHLASAIHAPDFSLYIETFGYVGVFIWFTIFDFVAPFPDEISLLSVGYLASQGFLNPVFVAVIAFGSFILTDTISFFLVRSSSSIFSRRLHKPKRHSVRAYIARNLEKNLPRTLIIICFIPRMRLWGPIVAGSSRIPFRKFITFDAIGVALFTTLYTTLGYYFGKSLSAVFDSLVAEKATIFVGVLLALGVVLIFISGKAMQKESHV